MDEKIDEVRGPAVFGSVPRTVVSEWPNVARRRVHLTLQPVDSTLLLWITNRSMVCIFDSSHFFRKMIAFTESFVAFDILVSMMVKTQIECEVSAFIWYSLQVSLSTLPRPQIWVVATS